MKKCCKNIDITDRAFISHAVRKCLSGGKNGKSKLSCRDTLRMLAEYSGVLMSLLIKIAKDREYQMFDGIIETIMDGIRQEIISGKIIWKPIWYTQRRENGKLRRIGIQDIKQQLYDYIAVEGLAEVFRKIGYYQCAAIPNKGQTMGMRAIKRWLRNRGLRYAWKGDAHHYYECIDTDRLKALLERYVANRLLLKLTFALIDSFERGLSIGSYLSQYLANFYMSFAYHYAEGLSKTRKHKNGTQERARLVRKVLIYMDDILFLGSSQKDLKMAVKRFRQWIWDKLRITLKPGDDYINLQTGYIDMMGYLISRQKVIVRSRIFRRFRKDIKRARKTGSINRAQAQRIISRAGWLDNAQCGRWMKRNKATKITKLCKEMISSGKDVIYVSAAGSDNKDPAGRKAGHNSPDGRGGDLGGRDGNGNGIARNRNGAARNRNGAARNQNRKRGNRRNPRSLPIQRKPVPDRLPPDGRGHTGRHGNLSRLQRDRRTAHRVSEKRPGDRRASY